MKKILISIFVCAMIVLAKPILAQDSGFGAGVILGEPTGLSAKLWTSDVNAFDFAVAWSLKNNNNNHNDNGNLVLQADYVWHFDLINMSSGKLPIYLGVGGRAVLTDDTRFGIRIPVGIDYLFADAPIDIFAEVVPTIDLSPSTNFGIGAGIGVRYWFN